MTITKTLEERAAYERTHTVITKKSSGFCAPKIKGDPFAEALRSTKSSIVTFDGDTLPTAFNVIGAGAQTVAHALKLANMSKLGYNPMELIPQILLSRYVTGFTYSRTRTVTTMDESRPLQSRIETGVLRVNNDRTHLEGIWDITGRGEILTGEFTTSAPRHTIDTHTETKGWSVSLSPAAILGACLAPESLAAPSMLGCLPNVSVQQVNDNSSETTHAPTIIRADDLFIRCNNAVFSGTQVHARLVDAIVTGDLTIETLTNEFRSESENTGFSACLGTIANLTKDVKPDASIFQNPRLGAVPHIRIANGEHLSRKIGELASIIGTERFYLTVGGLLYKKSAQVGLKPDGVVVHNDAERIQAARILEEQVQEIESHERHVFNPAVGEFVGMMAQVDELNEVRAKIAEEMAIQNKSPEEKREVNQDVKKALDIVRETERKITAKKQKSINKIKAAVLEKAPEIAAETVSMSDEEFIIFANMYMNSHNDSIASEIALQGVLLAQEGHEIASEAERKLDAMPMSGKAGLYISAIKDAVKEYGREYLDSPLDHTLDLAEGTAYFAADVFVPGGIDNAVDFYNGEISLNEAAVYQAAGAGADIFLGGMVKKAGAKVGRALSTASKGLTERVIEKIAKEAQQIPLLSAPKMQKHHIFNVFRGNSKNSQKYRDFFKKHNINIDSHCVDIPKTFHFDKIHVSGNNWTTKWKTWIDQHPNSTTKEVYQQAGLMMDEYGISHIPLIQYKK